MSRRAKKETLRTLSMILGKDDTIKIYDGETLVETVLAEEIRKNQDNFYTLSVVHVLEFDESGTYVAHIGEETNKKE